MTKTNDAIDFFSDKVLRVTDAIFDVLCNMYKFDFAKAPFLTKNIKNY